MYLSARGKQSAKNINVKAKTKASALLAVQVDVCLLFFLSLNIYIPRTL